MLVLLHFQMLYQEQLILGEDLGKSFKRIVQDALVKTVALLIEAML